MSAFAEAAHYGRISHALWAECREWLAANPGKKRADWPRIAELDKAEQRHDDAVAESKVGPF